MNIKNIQIFNYIFSVRFNEELDDDDKWTKFENLCSNSKIDGVNFLDENEHYFNMKGLKYFHNIVSGSEYEGRFATLNLNGEKAYYKFKLNELKDCINELGTHSFKNCIYIFNNMKNEAIREILNRAREEGLIDFDSNNAFLYADDELYNIIYENIKILSNEKKDIEPFNSIINYGTQIYQNGNYNTATITVKNDDDLFKLITEKLSILEMEMKLLNFQMIEEFKLALNKKDKKSILTMLSELVTIGSVIAPTILSMASQII